MKASAAGRAAVWTAAISVSGIDPHAAPVALGAAVVKESFDLLRARSHRVSVLAYLRAVGASTYLDIGPSPAAPALVLSVASPGLPRRDGKEGAAHMPADKLPTADVGLDPADFCIKHRADLLAYAVTRTRNWADAEEAVSHAVQRVFELHRRHGTLCPDGSDPVGWSKMVIRNYVTDRFRRSKTRDRGLHAFALPGTDGTDVADMVTDQIIARKALAFVASLKDRDHMIAVMRYVDGLEPKEIAEELAMNPHTVRTSLHRTVKKMRTQLGIAEPRKVFKEETT
jgi:RNA polymerase sigma-70 factor (ECF subfamily)